MFPRVSESHRSGDRQGQSDRQGDRQGDSHRGDSRGVDSHSRRVSLIDEAEEKSSYAASNSSGNNLSDVAARARSQDAKDSQYTSNSSNASNGNNGGNGGNGNNAMETFSQEEQREEMQARRRLWQEEVEFHEASVRRQRAAMIKEKEKMDMEQESLRGDRQGGGSSPTSPNAANDLRFKLRELEAEMEDLKSVNAGLEEKLTFSQRSNQREKEVYW